ncbi:MAG: ferredoxin [Actinobacteria bacterium]|nr:ferredoxin [Actinomycetota bacterium]
MTAPDTTAVTVYVDRSKCQGYGQCCFEADDVFHLDEDGKLVYVAESDVGRRKDIENAADVCPMQAITVS